MKKKTSVTPLFRLELGIISMLQFGALYLTLIISTIDIFIPYLIVQQAGRDGWVSVLAASLIMLPVSATIISLTLRFTRRSLIEYLQIILGRLPGRLIGLLYLFAILVVGAITLRELEEIMTLAFMTKTPQIVFGIIAICLSTYVVYSGFEVLNRVNGIVLPFGLFFLTFVIISVLPNADIANYLPILEKGFKQTVSGSLILVSQMAEGYLLLSALPFATQPRKIIGAAFIGIPLLIGALLLGTISIPVFGLESTLRLTMPALELARLIDFPGLPRLDILIMSGWIAGIILKVSVLHYLLALLTAQWTGLKSYKTLSIPLGVIIVSMSIILFSSTIELIMFLGSSYVYFLLTIEFVIPLILLIISWLRGVEEKETAS